jgi:hypothetical protein
MILPFTQTSGIGKQNQYLKQSVEQGELTIPDEVLVSQDGQLIFDDF